MINNEIWQPGRPRGQQKSLTVSAVVTEHPISFEPSARAITTEYSGARSEYPAFQRKSLVTDAAICARHVEISHKIIQFFIFLSRLAAAVFLLHFRRAWASNNVRAFVRFSRRTDRFGLLHSDAFTMEKNPSGGVLSPPASGAPGLFVPRLKQIGEQ